jgi:PAS domain S-box-containing protein
MSEPGPPPATTLFEESPDLLCVANLDGYFLQVNPSWTRVLGWSATELLSRPSLDFVHPDDRAAVLAARGRLDAGLLLTNFVNRYQHKDGSWRWLEWSTTARAQNGLVYAVARDVTDATQPDGLRALTQTQQRVQQQMRVADRLATVGALAAGAAHELNNPLASIIANLEVLVAEVSERGTDPEWSAALRESLHSAQRIKAIVRDLQTYSRSSREGRVEVDVRAVLQVAVRSTHHEVKQRARVVMDEGPLPHVLADEGQLGQVFMNLLLNAAQAIAPGHAATHEIQLVTSTDVRGRAVIEIRDTGSGFMPEVKGRIFDPFFSTKPVGEGTGLGLAVCHNIVTGLGGTITADDREGGGAVLRVVLPPAP